MLSLILFLVIVWIALGIIGAVVHGLLWLTIIAALLFVATLFFGGSHFGRRRARDGKCVRGTAVTAGSRR